VRVSITSVESPRTVNVTYRYPSAGPVPPVGDTDLENEGALNSAVADEPRELPFHERRQQKDDQAVEDDHKPNRHDPIVERNERAE